MASIVACRKIISTTRRRSLRRLTVMARIVKNADEAIEVYISRNISLNPLLIDVHALDIYLVQLATEGFFSIFEQIAGKARTVAVLGIKPESKASQPAYFVPEFLQSTGVEVIPVPVYFPEVKEILGKPVIRDLKKIKQQVDILDIFSRPEDLQPHLDDILAMDPKPSVVWLQSGIR